MISTADRESVASGDLDSLLRRFEQTEEGWREEKPQRRPAWLRRELPRLLRRDLTGPTCLVMSLGVLLQAVTTWAGRAGWGDPATDRLWWASLLAIVVPAAVRLLGRQAGDGERLALAVLMPVALMLSRVAEYPTRFMWHDELAHANALRELEATHHLFGANSLLPVSAFYPGLEVATSGVHQLSGLPVHAAAVVVLMLARVVQALAMVGIARRLTGSTRIAGIAALIYVCNPQYLYFNSQFAYQTLALPLVMCVAYLLLEQPRRRVMHAPVLAITVACTAALTHHLTTYLMIAALLAWLVLVVLLRDVSVGMRGIFLTCFAAGTTSLWMALRAGNPVVGYLVQIAQSSSADIVKRSRGQQTHQLFADFNGDKTPLWQQYTLTTSVIVTAVLLVPALWRARHWARRRGAFAVLFCLVAAMYPLIPAGHLTFATSEVFDRSAGFVYVALSCVFAVALTVPRGGSADEVTVRPAPRLDARPDARPASGRWVTAGLVALTGLLFVGGVILGSGPRWNRIPGGYLVAADPRSVDSANLAAAGWMRGALPPDSRVLGDRIGRLLAASIGGQHGVTQLGDQLNASSVLLAPRYTGEDLDSIRRARVAYVVVDRRLSGSLPRVGVYYEKGEWGSVGRRRPVPRKALGKLDRVRPVSRIYDNGAIAVYDVRDLRDE